MAYKPLVGDVIFGIQASNRGVGTERRLRSSRFPRRSADGLGWQWLTVCACRELALPLGRNAIVVGQSCAFVSYPGGRHSSIETTDVTTQCQWMASNHGRIKRLDPHAGHGNALWIVCKYLQECSVRVVSELLVKRKRDFQRRRACSFLSTQQGLPIGMLFSPTLFLRLEIAVGLVVLPSELNDRRVGGNRCGAT